jgi:hypothetical protein
MPAFAPAGCRHAGNNTSLIRGDRIFIMRSGPCSASCTWIPRNRKFSNQPPREPLMDKIGAGTYCTSMSTSLIICQTCSISWHIWLSFCCTFFFICLQKVINISKIYSMRLDFFNVQKSILPVFICRCTHRELHQQVSFSCQEPCGSGFSWWSSDCTTIR